jgi:hypothetical protein
MSTILKSHKGLKDLECMKGQLKLSSRPPILCAPLTNLVTTQESRESLKIKLLNGTVINMSIFSQGKTKEYLAHVVAVLHLINPNRLNVQCRSLPRLLTSWLELFGNLQKSTRPMGSSSKDEKEAHKLELVHTQEMLQKSQKAHEEAVAKTYELLRNLLSFDPQSQWDWVC